MHKHVKNNREEFERRDVERVEVRVIENEWKGERKDGNNIFKLK